MNRADTIKLQGHIVKSEKYLKVLELGVSTGVDPATNARFAVAWQAFHANRRQLTAKHLSRVVVVHGTPGEARRPCVSDGQGLECHQTP